MAVHAAHVDVVPEGARLGAVSDAMRSGFRPKTDHWLVADGDWTTHFNPGSSPIALGPSDVLVPRPQSVAKEADEPAAPDAGRSKDKVEPRG